MDERLAATAAPDHASREPGPVTTWSAASGAQATVLRLQRSAGNAATCVALRRSAVVQRSGPSGRDAARTPAVDVPVQRQDHPATPAQPAVTGRPQVLAGLVGEWRAAGLLDPPFRPPDVGAFPDLGPARQEPVEVGAPAAGGAMPLPQQPPPPGRPPLELLPGGRGAPAPQPTLAPRPVPPTVAARPVPPPPPALLGIVIVLLILLWPNSTAPAWMDSVSPITGLGYGSPEEYEWTGGLSQPQRDYLRHLYQARELQPDPAADGEGDPTAVPAPQTATDGGGRRQVCFAAPVPRRGGHARHDAYATRVTGSPLDYYVRTPAGLGINYDGLQTGTSNVWEVKTGFGWFHNPGSRSLTTLTLARWDVQKNLGMAIALPCGYTHLWAHPDKYIAAMLTTRWGGIPPVLALPER